MGNETPVENGSSILHYNIIQLAQFLNRFLRPRDRNVFEKDVRTDTNRASGISNFVMSLVAAPKSFAGRTQNGSIDGDNGQKTRCDKHNLPECEGKKTS